MPIMPPVDHAGTHHPVAHYSAHHRRHFLDENPVGSRACSRIKEDAAIIKEQSRRRLVGALLT